ncbi:MAG: spore cortex biosynthesis protein YabQ [Bacilli bacterium]
MDLQAQYAAAILMAMAGAVMGAVHDVYRTSLKEWRFLKRFSPLFDLAYWLVATVFVFTLLLGANDGNVRLVMFFLLGAGWLVYYKTAHALVVASTRLVVRFVLLCLRLLYKTIQLLIFTPCLYTYRSIVLLGRFADRGLFRIEPVLVWPVVKTGHGVLGGTAWGARQAKKYLRPIAVYGKEEGRRMANRYGTLLVRFFSGASSGGDDDDET